MLNPLTTEDISAFGGVFYKRLCDLNSWKLWGAGYVIAGGMSNDSFHYFRSWIVGKGKIVFDTALSNPDDLAPFIDDSDVENELLEYVAVEIAEERGSPDPRHSSFGDPDSKPEGEPFHEDTVAASFPKLSAIVR